MSDILYGGIPAYYAYRGRDPYLSFDGVDDRVSLVRVPFTRLDIDYEFDVKSGGYNGIIADSLNTFAVYCDPDSTSTSIYFKRIDGTGYFNSFSGYGTLSIRYDSTTSTASVYKNGVLAFSASSIPQLYVNTLGLVFGGYGILSVFSFNIDTVSYIQQGDQSPSTVLPSHPSGADGTLIGGTGWKYVGIDGHFSTNALLLNYINSTTLTAPLNIILLEPMDLTGIPSSKDGFAINIINGYAKKQNMNSYKMALAYSM